MGTITNLVKNSAKSSFNQLKSYDVKGKVNSALDMSGINLQIPDKVEVPDTVKNFKPNWDVKSIKLPAGVDSYLSPVASGLLSGVKLPAEIGGVKLPELPDLSSVSSKVDDYLSGMGLDTEKLGIRSVDEILKTPDLSALKGVGTVSTPDLSTAMQMPDLSSAMEGFDISSIQSQIDEITSTMPSMESIDISQYF